MSGSAGFGRTGYEEDELLMISGMQHYAFCRRQWGLIHLEQQWAENVLTYEGRQLHRRADDPYFTELRGDVLVSRAMPLVSYRLGLYGVADVVEFHAVVDSFILRGKGTASHDTFRFRFADEGAGTC